MDIALEGHLDDTNRRRGLLTIHDVRSKYAESARTGHSSKSSGIPAAKSPRNGTSKERGRGRKADAVLATNSGTYDRPAADEEKETRRDRAGISPTLFAVANESKNNVLRIKALNEIVVKGSKTRIVKKIKQHSDPRKEDEPPELVFQPEMTAANHEAPEM